MTFWHNSRKLPKPTETQLRDLTLNNVDAVVRRAKMLSCKMEREKVGSPLCVDMRSSEAYQMLTSFPFYFSNPCISNPLVQLQSIKPSSTWSRTPPILCA